MRCVKEKYLIFYKEEQIGVCFVYTDRLAEYTVWSAADKYADELKALVLDKDIKNAHREAISAIFEIMDDVHRVPGTKKWIWQSGKLKVERVPEDVDKFWIYRRSAEKGKTGYSPKEYDAPHSEGGRVIPGMTEWVSWYCFNRKEDGMYEAELDEAWYGGGGHNDGGTIHTEVPEEWLTLPYDEFLEHVVTLSAASHFGFTTEELKEKEGLKKFFGYTDCNENKENKA